MELPELLQDVIRCDLCETPVPSRHCDICHFHLCEECKGEHISDESKEHAIVSFKMRGSTPECSKHSSKICAQYCKKCNTPICALCVSSGKHKRHKTEHISKMADDKKEQMKNDLQTTLKLRCNTLICVPCVSSGKNKRHKTEETSKMSEGKREPRTNDIQTTKLILTKRNWIIIGFIFGFLTGCFHVYIWTFNADAIDRFIILHILLAILLFFLHDLMMFCLRFVGYLENDIGFFNLFFECLKWMITRIKEPRKNHSRTINFALLEKPVIIFIGFLIGYIFWVICLLLVPLFYGISIIWILIVYVAVVVFGVMLCFFLDVK
uniref:Uncharacterized protein LOC111115674 n=1 Tax=Crassostrea virginica TaxID=6565 RepID=A0A8B8C528_CRAVI|nr:uncharacterized protein LOC111115674 [Crassostrea virginica]XP_022310210.1 uncharacterized protein LOC111115674 [Crassostrea virginica]